MYRDKETLKFETANEIEAGQEAAAKAEMWEEPLTETEDAYVTRVLGELSLKEQTAAIAEDAARIRRIRLDLEAELAAIDAEALQEAA